MVLSFIAAVYNEQDELDDLLKHVAPYVDFISIMDDKSTDWTINILDTWWNGFTKSSREYENPFHWHQMDEHTGLPETVKNGALDVVPDGSWVLMLDADERFATGVLDAIKTWVDSPASEEYTHIYFQQLEIIDGHHVRTFQKSKLFRKEAVRFSTGIHEDDQFTGKGDYFPQWIVYHRKGSDKQRLREREYLETYKRLLAEGKIDQGRYEWLRGLHHFER